MNKQRKAHHLLPLPASASSRKRTNALSRP